MASNKDSYWIPLADLMTVLMVIFLFIAISYMAVIKKKQLEKDNLIKEFRDAKTELLSELNKEFKQDFAQSRWNAVLDSSDLSIKFIDERILFDHDKSELKPEFKSILTSFFPRYLQIILRPKYTDKIAEVRVEGHTSLNGDYIYNLKLSQDRTRNVVEFLRSLKYYKNLKRTDRSRLQYWLTANGLSYGRTLDINGKLTYRSSKPSDDAKSRRVEFKIVTTSDDLVNKAIEKIK